MVNAVTDQHPNLLAFTSHGATLFRLISQDTNAEGDCPFCRAGGKFHVNVKTLSWDCKKCGESGGLPQFLGKIHERNVSVIQHTELGKLATDRGVKHTTLEWWGVGYAYDRKHYTIPGYDAEGGQAGLFRYKTRGRIMATKGAKAMIFYGPARSEGAQEQVIVCEGLWDAMAMWEMCGGDRSVYGLAGNAFPGGGEALFSQKRVTLFTDADPAGIRIERRMFGRLDNIAAHVHSFHWPADVVEGYDVRDVYQSQTSPLAYLFDEDRLKPTPRVDPARPNARQVQSRAIEEVKLTGPGLSREEVIASYRSWLHLPDPEPLDVIFGSVFAYRLGGDPVWIFLISEAGGGKTDLLGSLMGSPLIITTSTLTSKALVSGQSTAGGGDPSFIPKCDKRVLVFKDFTSMLAAHPQDRDQIFATFREAFDGQVEREFGNGVTRSYKGLRFGILAGVTSEIEREASQTALGERFIKYRFPRLGKSSSVFASYDTVLRAAENAAIGDDDARRAELAETAAKCIDYELPRREEISLSSEQTKWIAKVAQVVGLFRGVVAWEKYTRELLYVPTPESGTRLAKQLTNLALGIAAFHRTGVTGQILRTIARVTCHTMPDITQHVVRALYERGEDWTTAGDVATITRVPSTTVGTIMKNLMLLRAIEEGSRSRQMWRLSREVRERLSEIQLYDTGDVIVAHKRRPRRLAGQ